MMMGPPVVVPPNTTNTVPALPITVKVENEDEEGEIHDNDNDNDNDDNDSKLLLYTIYMIYYVLICNM